MQVIVIGGVAAGMSAASKLKRLDSTLQITVFEKTSDVSYGACGMPYFLSDVIEKESSLIARTAETFRANGIDVHLRHEVTEVKPLQKSVSVTDLASGQSKVVHYDRLVIATGAKPFRLPIEGRKLNNIYTLNSLEDARQLKTALKQAQHKKIAVIGGGYIGLEVIENLALMNKDVRLIERLDNLLDQFDTFIGETALKTIKKQGIMVHLEETVEAYEGTDQVEKIVTDKGTYAVDIVIEAVGVKPNTDFLKGTGIQMLKNGAIIVNHAMETSEDAIYAGGDCVAYPHQLHDEPVMIPLGTHANKAGRVIAEQIVGNKALFSGVLGSTVLKVFDLEIAKTGLSEKEAKRYNIFAKSVDINAKDRAGYYPHATPIQMKMLYDPSTCRLLGAQMIGEKGIAHRINTVAVALANQMTAAEFSGLDFAYAPPFSPVYDPLQTTAMQIKCHTKKETSK